MEFGLEQGCVMVTQGRLAVLTGGGDCPGLNAVIRAVVKTAIQNNYEIYGIENGFNGLVADNIKKMNLQDVSGILRAGALSWEQPTVIILFILLLEQMMPANKFIKICGKQLLLI